MTLNYAASMCVAFGLFVRPSSMDRGPVFLGAIMLLHGVGLLSAGSNFRGVISRANFHDMGLLDAGSNFRCVIIPSFLCGIEMSCIYVCHFPSFSLTSVYGSGSNFLGCFRAFT